MDQVHVPTILLSLKPLVKQGLTRTIREGG